MVRHNIVGISCRGGRNIWRCKTLRHPKAWRNERTAKIADRPLHPKCGLMPCSRVVLLFGGGVGSGSSVLCGSATVDQLRVGFDSVSL
eukprot:7542120-Pyramimonas_sp.AAC.1